MSFSSSTYIYKAIKKRIKTSTKHLSYTYIHVKKLQQSAFKLKQGKSLDLHIVISKDELTKFFPIQNTRIYPVFFLNKSTNHSTKLATQNKLHINLFLKRKRSAVYHRCCKIRKSKVEIGLCQSRRLYFKQRFKTFDDILQHTSNPLFFEWYI